MKKILLAACAMLTLVACAPAPASSKAFDNRDPDVIYAEGIVEGTLDTTLRRTMKEYYLPLMNKWGNAHPDKKFKYLLAQYTARLLNVTKYVQKLNGDPEKGTSLVPKHPKILKMYELVAEANEPLFAMMKIIIREQEAPKLPAK